MNTGGSMPPQGATCMGWLILIEAQQSTKLNALPTKWTQVLGRQPLCNARPAEDMPTLGQGRVPQPREAQGAHFCGIIAL
mmetsp:Transcript_8020/g.24169  ORF Transcript_8020/g.24169 Transcript_8020/m.24169 type:complete len:80 (+) Transcript_8020:1240-1479(+)